MQSADLKPASFFGFGIFRIRFRISCPSTEVSIRCPMPDARSQISDLSFQISDLSFQIRISVSRFGSQFLRSQFLRSQFLRFSVSQILSFSDLTFKITLCNASKTKILININSLSNFFHNNFLSNSRISWINGIKSLLLAPTFVFNQPLKDFC